jgi:hypothetical protein
MCIGKTQGNMSAISPSAYTTNHKTGARRLQPSRYSISLQSDLGLHLYDTPWWSTSRSWDIAMYFQWAQSLPYDE